jgi:hypothetical protein
MNGILLDYILMFGEEPPKTTTMGFDNAVYQSLIIDALSIGEAITTEQLEQALAGKEYDLETQQSFSNFGKD